MFRKIRLKVNATGSDKIWPGLVCKTRQRRTLQLSLPEWDVALVNRLTSQCLILCGSWLWLRALECVLAKASRAQSPCLFVLCGENEIMHPRGSRHHSDGHQTSIICQAQRCTNINVSTAPPNTQRERVMRGRFILAGKGQVRSPSVFHRISQC